RDKDLRPRGWVTKRIGIAAPVEAQIAGRRVGAVGIDRDRIAGRADAAAGLEPQVEGAARGHLWLVGFARQMIAPRGAVARNRPAGGHGGAKLERAIRNGGEVKAAEIDDLILRRQIGEIHAALFYRVASSRICLLAAHESGPPPEI